MSVPKTQFSAAIYRPDPGSANPSICDDHRKLLWTPGNSPYRVENLVDGIAQKFFKIDAEDDFRIKVKNDRIEIHMIDSDTRAETGEVHLLERDEAGWWHKTGADGTSSVIEDLHEHSQIEQGTIAIIERVKALWEKCQADHKTPATAAPAAAGHAHGACHGCHGGGNQQPTIIIQHCHDCDHDAELPLNFGDTLERLRQRIAELEAAMRQMRAALEAAERDHPAEDPEAARLRDALARAEAELARLQAQLRDMAGLRDQAARDAALIADLRRQLGGLDLLRREAAEKDALIARLQREVVPPHDRQTFLQTIELLYRERDQAATAYREAQRLFKVNFPMASAFVEGQIFPPRPVFVRHAV